MSSHKKNFNIFYAPPGGPPPMPCMDCWLSSANRTDARAECFKNFSQHFETHCFTAKTKRMKPSVKTSTRRRSSIKRTRSSSFSKLFLLKDCTHVLKHLSTRLLYIFKLYRRDQKNVFASSVRAPFSNANTKKRWLVHRFPHAFVHPSPRRSSLVSSRLIHAPIPRLHRLNHPHHLRLILLREPLEHGWIHRDRFRFSFRFPRSALLPAAFVF